MSVSKLEDILDEIERCKNLYPEFNQDQGIIKLMFQTRNQIKKDYGTLVSAWIKDLTQEQADKSFKNDITIISKAGISKEVYLKFLGLICTNIINKVPALVDPLEGLSSYIREDLKDFQDTIDTEKVCETINKSFEEIHIQKDFTTFIFTFVLSSLYQWHVDDLINKISTKLWTKGYCPICGKNPHYGMLRQEDGAKVMECWQCTARWVHSRLKCPFCETTDHNELGYFTAGSNETCRIYFCNRCKKYYKIYDFRERNHHHVFLPVHHIATLSHDIFALQEGYQPGSSLQWVNNEELILK